MTGLALRMTGLALRTTGLALRTTGLAFRMTGLAFRMTGLALLMPFCAQAGCPQDQSEHCLLGVCACVSDELVDTTRRAAGLLLEQWLVQSREAARDRALPIPAALRARLAPFVDKAVLDTARYKIGDESDLDLADLNLRYGDLAGNQVAAVTLIDVIVFRDARTAADPAVWAHELHHVKQFRDWGVHEFAMRYARDFHSVEDPAYAFQRRVPH